MDEAWGFALNTQLKNIIIQNLLNKNRYLDFLNLALKFNSVEA